MKVNQFVSQSFEMYIKNHYHNDIAKTLQEFKTLGLSYPQIAAETNYSEATIRKYFRKYEIRLKGETKADIANTPMRYQAFKNMHLDLPNLTASNFLYRTWR
ncbi:hypothetical protein [Fangia hongkongensis]|uniref:hypothetical protein n=1 Tax=Fangia hongkongensis TaxID=270495 RepID=UPI000376BD3E|nr:hypothetical protein [Fangia hongkongensis]MBK2124398.1 hypothetical protein [Fangia hongkongensis]